MISERSTAHEHSEPASPDVGESGEPAGEPAGAHEDGDGSTADEEGHAEGTASETHTETSEAVLGVNVESTPLIVLAVIFGLGTATLAATRLGRLRAVLLAVTVIALAWAALDVREVVHQLDESRTGIAILAIVVAVLHLAAALLAGAMAMRERQLDGGSPARPVGFGVVRRLVAGRDRSPADQDDPAARSCETRSPRNPARLSRVSRTDAGADGCDR